jgi:alpha-galactosidase
MKKLLAFSFLLLINISVFAQDNAKLAPTPPMGWNSWNKFACNVSETLIKGAADAMVSSGMKDAGYQYIVIDDCWQVSRDKDGTIVADPKTFPSGIKALADYVHSKGLKFGIYTDIGTKTCAGRPATRGYEYQDARTYASWGVDYVKVDWCNTVGAQDAASSYTTFRDALNATGRPIVLSICEWGTAKPWLWGEKAGGNLWRTTGDITDKFEGKVTWPGGGCCAWGMVNIVDMQEGIESFSGPGHWNDPDMLEVGNGGMTTTEYRSHFSLWAILAAPLMAGNDLGNMTPEIKEILTNKEVIAIDQDPLGRQGRRIARDGDLEVYARPLADGGRAVVLFNRGASEKPITVKWEQIGYPAHLAASVRDLWQHKDLGNSTGQFTATVASHGVVMVRIRP